MSFLNWCEKKKVEEGPRSEMIISEFIKHMIFITIKQWHLVSAEYIIEVYSPMFRYKLYRIGHLCRTQVRAKLR